MRCTVWREICAENYSNSRLLRSRKNTHRNREIELPQLSKCLKFLLRFLIEGVATLLSRKFSEKYQNKVDCTAKKTHKKLRFDELKVSPEKIASKNPLALFYSSPSFVSVNLFLTLFGLKMIKTRLWLVVAARSSLCPTCQLFFVFRWNRS